MGELKQVIILFCLGIRFLSAKGEDSDDAKRLEIEALEKQKSALYVQINDAIDDSVKTLAENNDADSKLGINLITDLKKQLELLNGTDLIKDQLEIQNDTRRRSKHRDDENKKSKKNARKFEAAISYRKSKKGDKLFSDDLLEKAEISPKYKERLEHRIKMQYRIEDWLKKKAEEKNKIKKYIYNGTLQSSSKKEKCPRFGKSSKKKSKKYKGWYPCCRKCCKKSYMGCLK